MQAEPIIHRHTGGLEIECIANKKDSQIHRHTGGLENKLRVVLVDEAIHRHTGGLEIHSERDFV